MEYVNLEKQLSQLLLEDGLASTVPYNFRLKYTRRMYIVVDILTYICIAILIPHSFWFLIFWALFFLERIVILRYTKKKGSNWDPLFRVFMYVILFSGFNTARSVDELQGWLVIIILYACWDFIFGFGLRLHKKYFPILDVPSELSQPTSHESLINMLDTKLGHITILVILLFSIIHEFYTENHIDILLFLEGLILWYILIKYCFPGFRRLEKWEGTDEFIDYVTKFITQSFQVFFRWTVIVTPSIVVTSFLSFLSTELWVIINRPSLAQIIAICAILIIASFVIALLQAQKTLEANIHEIDFRKIEITKLAFTRIIDSNRNKSIYHRLLDSLQNLKNISSWKLNDYLFNSLRAKIAKEYNYRTLVSLLISTLLILPLSYILSAAIYLFLLPKDIVTEWTATESNWYISIQAPIDPQLLNLPNPFSVDSLEKEPTLRLAFFSTSIVISILLLQAGSSSKQLFKLIGLTTEKLETQLAVLMFFYWCTQEGYQVLDSPFPLHLARGNKFYTRFYTIWNCSLVIHNNLQNERLAQIAEEISKFQRSLYCIVFTTHSNFIQSLRSNASMRLIQWYDYGSEISTTEWLEMLERDDSKSENLSNPYWMIYNPRKNAFSTHKSLISAINYAEQPSFAN